MRVVFYSAFSRPDCVFEILAGLSSPPIATVQLIRQSAFRGGSLGEQRGAPVLTSAALVRITLG